MSKSQEKLGFLIFECQGHYYKTDKSGMDGVKEMIEYKKNLAAGIDNQISLI